MHLAFLSSFEIKLIDDYFIKQYSHYFVNMKGINLLLFNNEKRNQRINKLCS